MQFISAKKRKLLIIMMAALAAVAFSACEKENKEVQQHDPVADDDQTEITEYDGLE